MRATSMLSGLGYATLRAAGLPALSRSLSRGGLILGYHNVLRERHTPPPGDPGLHLPGDRFHAQMEWLARHYEVIPLAELVARMLVGRPLRGLVALTFDDGYDGVFDAALPILRSLGLPATLFVVGAAPDIGRPFWWDHPAVVAADPDTHRWAWLETLRGDGPVILQSLGAPTDPPANGIPRSATWQTIAAAAGHGIDLGAHSLTHRTLTRLDDAELAVELERGRDFIVHHTGVRPVLFAYPYGHWDRRVRDEVQHAGYAAAVTLDPGFIAGTDDPWSLKRLNIPAGLGQAGYACWLAGIRRPAVAWA